MRFIGGPVTEVRELGVVGEQCPCCMRVRPCRVRAVCQGWRFFFVKKAATPKEISCLCGTCGMSFPCELWRYPALLPAAQADALAVKDLLEQTNPRLAERLQLQEQVYALGGDSRFAAAYEQLEGMRTGELHSLLLQHLLVWECLGEEQRGRLVQRIGDCARAWLVARQVAPGFPGHAGTPAAFLAALAVWSAFAWAPVVRHWLWGSAVALAGCAAAALTCRVFLIRQVRRWTREVLVPAAQRANVSLACFLGVVDDLPGTRQHVLDDTWPLKDQVETIRGILAADGRL
jgi:hypothetical protein